MGVYTDRAQSYVWATVRDRCHNAQIFQLAGPAVRHRFSYSESFQPSNKSNHGDPGSNGGIRESIF